MMEGNHFLEIILQVLSGLGIILLVLLGVLAVFLLLALFFPVSYSIRGSREEDEMWLSAKAKWLFGLLRAEYKYPEPGRATVKLLWFTLYDSMTSSSSEESQNTDQPSGSSDGSQNTDHLSGSTDDSQNTDHPSGSSEESQNTGQPSNPSDGSKKTDQSFNPSKDSQSTDQPSGSSDSSQAAVSSSGPGTEDGSSAAGASDKAKDSGEDRLSSKGGKISEKIEKIKYTIHSICDKIKKIWKNISYYMVLMQEEETKQLMGHLLTRFGKVLKSIRPRKIRADILFGTGAPDTTGYVYGMYCMLASVIGARFCVTPDFEQAVLKGRIDISGCFTIWILVVNGLKLLLDKRLHRFLRKLKGAATGQD